MRSLGEIAKAQRRTHARGSEDCEERERDRGEVKALVWYWEEEGGIVRVAVTSATEKSGRRSEEEGRRPYRFEAR